VHLVGFIVIILIGHNFLIWESDIFGGNQRRWSIVCWENLKLKDSFGDVFIICIVLL